MGGPDFWARFVLAVLAVWRVAYLLSSEDGPGAIVARLRAALGASWAGQAMDCFTCMSLWVAAPLVFLVGGDATQLFVTWLALSGAALALERLMPERPAEPLIIERLSETLNLEMDDGMLQPETRGPDRLASDDQTSLAAGS